MFGEDVQTQLKEFNHRAPSASSLFLELSHPCPSAPADPARGQGFPRRPVSWSRRVYYSLGRLQAPEHSSYAVHFAVCTGRERSQLSAVCPRDGVWQRLLHQLEADRQSQASSPFLRYFQTDETEKKFWRETWVQPAVSCTTTTRWKPFVSTC